MIPIADCGQSIGAQRFAVEFPIDLDVLKGADYQ